MTSLNGARLKARDTVRRSDANEIRMALELYYDDHGEYPPSGGTTAVFSNGVVQPAGWSNSGNASWTTLEGYLSEYLPKLPKDPVNDPLLFRRTYNYYSKDYGCNQQWYMLIYGVESTSELPDTIATTCSATVPQLGYADAVTTGDCKSNDCKY